MSKKEGIHPKHKKQKGQPKQTSIVSQHTKIVTLLISIGPFQKSYFNRKKNKNPSK